MRIRIGFLIMFLLAGILSAATLEETIKKEIPFIPNGEIQLSNVNGKVEITGWEKNTVLITAYKKVKAGSERDARKGLEALKVQINRQDGQLLVDTKYPKSKGGFWDWIFGDHLSASVQYEVFVPWESKLKLKTVNGSIEVKKITGKVNAKTVNGSVNLEKVSGEVRIKTVNGSIHAQLMKVQPSGQLMFATVNGAIKIYLPDSIHANIHASTTNGSIETEFPLEVVGKFTRKKIDGQINGGGDLDIELETVNGSITIKKVEPDSWGSEMRRELQFLKGKVLEQIQSFHLKLPNFLRNIIEKFSIGGLEKYIRLQNLLPRVLL